MYCKNCGEKINDIYKECPYCKTKTNENYEIYNQETGLNRVLYVGMNGKPVTLWKFILGIILLVGGALGAIITAISSGSNW